MIENIVQAVAYDRPQGAQEPKKSPIGDEPLTDFLARARTRFRMAADAESDIRTKSLEDVKFYNDEQWKNEDVIARDKAGRPHLVLNRIKPIVKQVVNEQRQARPAIEVTPVGDESTVETAQVIQGLIRHIELISNADTAYDTAFEHSTVGGFGYIRVLTDYADDESNAQDIFIEQIKDPFRVYFDPHKTKPDYSDARFAFIVSDIDKDTFKELHPDSELVGLPDFTSIGDADRGVWFGNGKIRVAEYYWVETNRVNRIYLTDGTSVPESELTDQHDIALGRDGKPVMRVINERKVYWCKMNAREVLEFRELPGKSIPIIPVLGDEYVVDGKRELCGLVRGMKDAQRQYNFQRSALVEVTNLGAKGQWVAAEGTIEGFEDLYAAANTSNITVLPYKAKTVDGQLVPPPHRDMAAAPIQATTIAVSQAENDLYATSGIYPPQLGAPGPEQSGKAILLRQRQGNVANYNWMDNLRRSLRQIGRVIIDWIPVIYDTERVMRIVQPDGTPKIVPINALHMGPNGQPQMFDLTRGKYDVSISSAPSHQSRRQELVDSLLAFVTAAPQVAPVVMDLIARNSDWPGANQVADRLQKMLPPGLQEPDENNPQAQVPPEIQAKMSALLQQHEQLVQQLESTTETMNSRRMELASREKIAEINAQTQLVVADIKAQAQASQALLMGQLQSIAKRLDLLDAEAGRQHQAELQAAAQQAQAAQAAQAAPGSE